MNSVGVFVPGTGAAHRLSAGVKLLALVVVLAGVMLGDHRVALGAAVVAAALYPLCGIDLRFLWRTLRSVLVLCVIIAVVQVLTAEWTEAVKFSGRLLTAVLLAGLVTRTTRIIEMLELFERLARPLRIFGVRPERVALMLALTLRCIPLVTTAWQQAREAYAARGLRGSPHRMVVPVIVRLLRSADAMGDAMSARGIE